MSAQEETPDFAFATRRSRPKAKKEEKPKFKLTSCIPTQPSFQSQVSKAMVEKMGLSRFIFYTEVPVLNRQHCLDFFATYDTVRGCGVVNDRNDVPVTIFINAHLVHEVTGLPLGDTPSDDLTINIITDFLGGDDVLETLVPSARKRKDEYYLPDLVYNETDDCTKEFFDIAVFLQEKLMCKTTFKNYSSPELLVGMYRALQGNRVLPWAAFMAFVMKTAIQQIGKKELAFGGWLSGMIQRAFLENKIKADPPVPKPYKRSQKKRQKLVFGIQEKADHVILACPAAEKLPARQEENIRMETSPENVQKQVNQQVNHLVKQIFEQVLNHQVQQQAQQQVNSGVNPAVNPGVNPAVNPVRVSDLEGELRVTNVELKHALKDAQKYENELEKLQNKFESELDKAKAQNVELQNKIVELETQAKMQELREKMMEDMLFQVQSKCSKQERELREKQSQVVDMLSLTKNPMEAVHECLKNRSEKREPPDLSDI